MPDCTCGAVKEPLRERERVLPLTVIAAMEGAAARLLPPLSVKRNCEALIALEFSDSVKRRVTRVLELLRVARVC